nr:GNAT family protein [cf. Phormidesmis sp. LEGE 11477]
MACCINRHLCLRPLALADTDALFALTDANRSYLRQWLPWLDSNLNSKDTRAFIKQKIEKAYLCQELVSAIFYDHIIVGLIGLHDINWSNRSSSIGYWLDAAHQGKGVMTLACQSMIDYGFTTLNLNRIDICCAVGNDRSEAVAKRLGLTYEGTLREAEWLYDHFVDLKVNSMLRYEWDFCL